MKINITFAYETTNTRDMDNNITTKVCSRCGRELPLTEFDKSAHSKDGHQSYCKDCKRDYYRNSRNINRTPILSASAPVSKPVAIAKADPFEGITSRELLAELKRRGYVWGEMWIKQTVRWDKI